LVEYYHIGVIDKTNIPVTEINLSRKDIEAIIRAYHAKHDMIVKNKKIDVDTITEIGIYESDHEIKLASHFSVVYFATPEAHVRTDLPQAWERAKSQGKDITRQIIEEIGNQQKRLLQSRQPNQQTTFGHSGVRIAEERIVSTIFWMKNLVLPVGVAVIVAVTVNLIGGKVCGLSQCTRECLQS
jgi:hypothetical protein